MGTAFGDRFRRNFLIFVNEDSGFEEGGRPSGHVMMEVRDGKGKLETVIHNLRNGKGRYRYALYLVRQSDGGTDYVRMGEITHTAGRAELRCRFEPRGAGDTPRPVDQYDVAAVVVEYGDGDGPQGSIICPLAAYRNKTAGWRNGLREALLRERGNVSGTQTQPRTVKEAKPETGPAPGRKEEPGPEQEQGRETGPGMEQEQRRETGPGMEQEMETETGPGGGHVHAPGPDQGLASDGEAEREPEEGPGPGEEADLEEGPGPGEEAGWEPEGEKGPGQEQEYQHELGGGREHAREPGQETERDPGPGPAAESDPAPGPATGNDPAPGPARSPGAAAAAGRIDTDCVYLNGNICDALVNNQGKPDPCGSCRINRNGAKAGTRPPGDVDGLECDLDRHFEVCDPFRSGRSDYKWWKVTNPVNLNNILYENNIRSPLMFNPAVMLAHYRYKHLIIGIFRHKNGKKYVVCGVPGRYVEDMKPFGEMNKWVQVQGTRPRYGAFGYWLVYIDPDNGRILHPNR